MRREEFDRIGDGRLVKRLEELLAAKHATELELAKTIAEYGKRRAAVRRSGKEITGELAKPLAIDQQTRESLIRREQNAAQHAECDAQAMRDPLYRTMINA